MAENIKELPPITGTAEQWKELYYKEQAELTALRDGLPGLHIERHSPDGPFAVLQEKGKVDYWLKITEDQLPWFNALRNLLRVK